MKIWSETILIDAPLNVVFDSISQPEKFREAVPNIVDLAFFSSQHYGLGTRFKETRIINKRKIASVFEIIELEEHSHVRLISKANGITWDSTFSTEAEQNGVQLRLVRVAIPHHVLARITLKITKVMQEKRLRQDMKSIKSYCEKQVA